MITINALLRLAGLDLATARLVRHQDKRGPTGRTPYSLWLADDGSFDGYQAIQSSQRFVVGGTVIAFVVTPIGETVFVGVYSVAGMGIAPKRSVDPLHGHDVTGLHLYSLRPHDALRDYQGRIVVDWGPGARAWVQRAATMEKPVLELRRTQADPVFPGFDGFIHTIGGLSAVPRTWRAALSAVSGIYLLVSVKTGKQYVGSATGSEGFWGRWAAYASNGHGGNAGLRLAAEDNYSVTILEVASSTASIEEILALESKWKAKLLSRAHGSNRN
jgi:hypothetical protein